MNNPTPPSPLSASIALVTPPSISDTTHTLSVVINFPTNGVSGSRGLSKTITFNFAKSIKQVDTAA